MSVTHHRSLLARIDEREARSTRVKRSTRDSGQQPSFAERYRGTEFAAPLELVRTGRPTPRGRVYVIVLGAAAAVTVALAVVANAG